MTLASLDVETLARAGVLEPARVVEAARPVAAWLSATPIDAVIRGLVAAADPTAALHGLARLAEQEGAVPTPATLEPLLQVLGGSPALASGLAVEGPGWADLFTSLTTTATRDLDAHRRELDRVGAAGPLPRAELQRVLRWYRRRELIRIGGRDLLGLANVDDTVRELSVLAEAVIDAAVNGTRARLAVEWGGDPPVAFSVLGMGKLGGGELNYSSDVDLVYLYERDGEHLRGRTLQEFFARLGEEVTRVVADVTQDGFCFRVDLRLRPGGGEGPVAASLPAAVAYYEAFGQTWERAVWLKARPVAGVRALGDALLRELEPFVYRRYLDFGTVEDLKAMKRRIDASIRGPAQRERDVKLGRGGIREVEFVCQALQLIHGGKDARLRRRGTLATLTALEAGGYLDGAQAAALSAAYRFLRDVEHKLQIVHQRQTHSLPEDAGELLHLARRLRPARQDPVAAFSAQHAAHTAAVHEAFSMLFHGAEEERQREVAPELLALIDELDQPEQTYLRLGRLDFRDPDLAYQNLRLLRDGPPHAPASPRRRQALAALAPALVGEIARSGAADRALHHMATFITTVGARTSYLHLLLENPGVLRLLVRLFASSELLSRFFVRHPELLDSLMRADLVRVRRTTDDLRAELGARLAAAADLEAQLDELRRFRHEEFLRIGVHDIQGELPSVEVNQQLTTLAEVCLSAALDVARREALRRDRLPAEPPTGGLGIVGLGKLGGAELNYNSDLDLVFIYDAGDPSWWSDRHAVPHEFFTRVAQRVLSALQTPTREGVAYRIDTRLRPSGNQGPLVSAIDAFETYHAASAAVWERQALIKARMLVGPPALCARFDAVVERVVYRRGLTDAEVHEIARIRERMEHERGGHAGGERNIKTGRGGLVDVEFLVQMLQLRHGAQHAGIRARGTREALAALASAGFLPLDDARALTLGYAFLRGLENRLRIDQDRPVEAIDTEPEALLPLARRLGYEGSDRHVVARLHADHARHRDAIRAAYERAFAGE